MDIILLAISALGAVFFLIFWSILSIYNDPFGQNELSIVPLVLAIIIIMIFLNY